MGVSNSVGLVLVLLVAAAMFTVQLGLVTAAAAAAVADDKNIIIINRELRERRPPPFRPKSPLANQQPGMRLPAPDPPPPPPPPPSLPNNFNNNRA
ncbi:probable glycosyltransferase 4 [Prunus avium]|uniref:Probable glycosyltransferase 4 n=1 Tax=Prunus avium TaxID=42229 RepID=A0A6P5RE80_PRUAV|nr:probable glycosyltransferase 4 [Prunus avium]